MGSAQISLNISRTLPRVVISGMIKFIAVTGEFTQIDNLSLIGGRLEFFIPIGSRENAGGNIQNEIPKALAAPLVPSDLRARFGRRKFALLVSF